MDLAPNRGGEHDKRAMMAKVLESDRLYVMDRGYQKFVDSFVYNFPVCQRQLRWTSTQYLGRYLAFRRARS